MSVTIPATKRGNFLVLQCNADGSLKLHGEQFEQLVEAREYVERHAMTTPGVQYCIACVSQCVTATLKATWDE